MPPEDKSPLNPESVLAAALADHDFIGPIGRQAPGAKRARTAGSRSSGSMNQAPQIE
jgi:hypothetical protein